MDIRDQEYKRPIHRAIKYNHQDVFDYLLNHPKVQLYRIAGSFGDYAFNSAAVAMIPFSIPHVKIRDTVS
jgi:ankyrin repeat protein